MDGSRDVKITVFNWLAFSLVVYSIIVFGVVLIFSGKIPYSMSEIIRGLSEYLGILAFISNHSSFSDIAQVMFVFNFFVIPLVFYVVHFSGVATISVKERGVWKHLFVSISLLVFLIAGVCIDTSSSSSCATRGCRLYEEIFDTEILFSIYISVFLFMFSFAASQLVFCLSDLMSKENNCVESE